MTMEISCPMTVVDGRLKFGTPITVETNYTYYCGHLEVLNGNAIGLAQYCRKSQF